jgi:hypothetical protein
MVILFKTARRTTSLPRQNKVAEGRMRGLSGMKMHSFTRGFAIAMALTILSPAQAQAADQTTEVKFKSGANSATIKGSLKGYDTNNYILGANAGQLLKVSLKASNDSCYFNVDAPTGDEAMFNGSMAVGDFSGTLNADGNYKAMVYLMRNAARRSETCRYTITFEIDN